jgi:exonuclease III
MKLKIASYNVSGGFYIGDESTEYLDREASDKIDNRLLTDLIEIINKENIDVLCLQEVITTERIKYIDQIKESTNLKYSESFELSPCNLVKDTDCGLAILSKYPLSNTQKQIFTNPKLSKTTSSGNTYYTYDKGWLLTTLTLNNESKTILTHHGFPYRRFNSTPEANPNIFLEFDEVIKNNNIDIITGDFNADNFEELMLYTKENYIRTINNITTVDGKKFDDILIKNDIKYKTEIKKSVSDHYMVITTIE